MPVFKSLDEVADYYEDKRQKDLEKAERKRWTLIQILISAAAVIVAASGLFVAYYTSRAQIKIQSEAARTSQTGWLTPGKSLRAETIILEQNYRGTVIEDHLFDPVAEYTSDIRVKIWLSLHNYTTLPLQLVGKAAKETISNSAELWTDIKRTNKYEGLSLDQSCDDVVGLTVEPGDSVVVCQMFTLNQADSSGISSGHVMFLSLSPYNRLTATYLWIDYWTALAIQPPPKLPITAFDAVAKKYSRASILRCSYKVCSDQDEDLVLTVGDELASKDTLAGVTEFRRKLNRPKYRIVTESDTFGPK